MDRCRHGNAGGIVGGLIVARVLHRFRRLGEDSSAAGRAALGLVDFAGAWRVIEQDPRRMARLHVLFRGRAGHERIARARNFVAAIEAFHAERDRIVDLWWHRLGRRDMVRRPVDGPSRAEAAARHMIADEAAAADLVVMLTMLLVVDEGAAIDHAYTELAAGRAWIDERRGAIVGQQDDRRAPCVPLRVA